MATRTKTPQVEAEAEQPTPEAQAASDAELMAYLQDQLQQSQPQREKPKKTVGETYVDLAILLADVKTKTRLNEATLVKLMELTLMWTLNNRQTMAPEVYPDPETGEPVDGADAPDTETE